MDDVLPCVIKDPLSDWLICSEGVVKKPGNRRESDVAGKTRDLVIADIIMHVFTHE